MAHWIKAGGTPEEVVPSNGKKFTLDELQAFVGGYIERLEVRFMGAPADMILNEEGQLLRLPVNFAASIIAQRQIVGNVLLVRRREW